MTYEEQMKQMYKNDISEINIREREQFKHDIKEIEGLGKIQKEIERLKKRIEELEQDLGRVEFTEAELITKISKQVYSIIAKNFLEFSNQFLDG